jgi:hypothetical protein
VNTNIRNARVVICLILAMTAGARILLWLEPAPAITEPLTSLTAVGGEPIEDVLIEYAPPGEPLDDSACLIWPDGHRDGEQLGPRVRLVVVGTEKDALPEQQKHSLLTALGSIAWCQSAREAEAPIIHLDRSSDPRVTKVLRTQARELYDMLVAKRFID